MPQLHKLAIPSQVGPCHRLVFIGTDQLLLATPQLTLQLLSIPSSSSSSAVDDNSVGSVKLVDTLDKDQGGFEARDCIHLMDASKDGRYAAVADHSGTIVLVDMKSLTVHSTLPRYKSHPTAMAFHPASKLIVVAYADHKVISFNFQAICLFVSF